MDNINEQFDLIIIGGGAAGLAAAVSYGKRRGSSSRYAVIEKERKPGRKLLATGSGRCNLTNLDMSEDYYNDSAKAFVSDVISRMTPERLVSEFKKLGLLCKPDEAGRVYPYSNRSDSVLDVLTNWLEHTGAKLFCDTKIDRIEACAGRFVLYSGNKCFHTEKLILAAGGRVQKNLGSDGSSYEFARQLGLECTPVFPSLAPIIVNDKSLSLAKGVRTAASVSVICGGKKLHTEVGELQFNEKNISGICIFQLSRYVNEYFAGVSNYKKPVIIADLAPDISKNELTDYFYTKQKILPETPVSEMFTGLLNKKLGAYLLKRANISGMDNPISRLSENQLEAIVNIVKECSFEPCAISAENSAQVTAGGVALTEIDRNFRSRKYKGLYIVGEALDADGLCGGYNLHMAFAGGFISGAHAAKEEKKHDKNKRA